MATKLPDAEGETLGESFEHLVVAAVVVRFGIAVAMIDFAVAAVAMIAVAAVAAVLALRETVNCARDLK